MYPESQKKLSFAKVLSVNQLSLFTQECMYVAFKFYKVDLDNCDVKMSCNHYINYTCMIS